MAISSKYGKTHNDLSYLPQLNEFENTEYLAYSTWNCRDCIPLITLLEEWMPLLPEWILENILDQQVLPRLTLAVEEWNPLTDTVPIHTWTHPWLPLLGWCLIPWASYM